MTYSMERIIYVALSLVFLILALVLLTSLLRSLNPQEQVALANAEKLRAAIDEACFRHGLGEEKIIVSVNMPQTAPLYGSVFSILPRWIMRTTGDPNYVLYYETFPPGEAVGWETYHDFKSRLVVVLPEGFEGKTAEEVRQYLVEKQKSYEEETGDKVDEIFAANVILNDEFDAQTRIVRFEEAFVMRSGEAIRGTTSDENVQEFAEKAFSLGSWTEGAPSASRDQFSFTNYLSLSTLDKATLKYYACGDNALCLKTRDGIHRFPLEQCGGIDYIQLVYDASDPLEDAENFARGATEASVGGFLLNLAGKLPTFIAKVSTRVVGGITALFGIADLAKSALYWATSWKVSDFYIASPCEQNFEIEITECSSDSLVSQHVSCARPVTYPIYEFGSGEGGTGSLAPVGSHTTCADAVLGDEDVDEDLAAFGPDIGQCVRITAPQRVRSSTFSGSGDFCWTFNPYVEHADDSFFQRFGERIKEFEARFFPPAQIALYLTGDIALREVAGPIGGLPVTYTASYDTDSGFFTLLSSEEAQRWYDRLEQASGSPEHGRYLHWGWP